MGRPSILIVGGDSAIGAAAARVLQARDVPVLATTRRPESAAMPARLHLDLAAPLDGWTPPAGIRTAVIAAAAARLADCAADPDATARVNVAGTLALVRRLVEARVHIVFLSTDKVFPGTRPRVPAHAPHAPRSAYGRQKAAAEAGLAAVPHAPHAILRLSKVVPPDFPLVRDWHAALAAGRPVRAFADMTLAPVPLALAAEAISAIVLRRAHGVYQLSGPQDVTYLEVAQRLARRLGAPANLVTPQAARAAGQPEGADAAHTTLDSSAVETLLGRAVPGPWEVLNEAMGERPASRMAGIAAGG
jgi:dTDP-4-dehydrorhamnose reductase